MNRDAWFIFAGIAAALALGLLGNTAWQKHQELRVAKVRLQEMSAEVEQRAVKLGAAEQRLAAIESKAETLALEMAKATNTQSRLETEMRAAMQSRDVAVSALQGKLTVDILDRILFDSGDATLKPEGMKVLDQVAGVLSGFTNRQVQIFGHTDNVPIRLRFPSNWELSTARALAAVRYLSEKAGVDARRLSAVGCGEFQPIADNATAEGRARNRRIALVVLPEQFAATDVSAAGSVTNAPNAGSGTNTNTSPNTNTAPVVPQDAVKETVPAVEAPAPVLGLPTNAVPE
jgi:chemotaxis protein MotB